MKLLARAFTLERLIVRGAAFDDSHMEPLGALHSVEGLWLNPTPNISDKSFSYIAKLDSLEELVLWGAGITGEKIDLLQSLPRLRKIQLGTSRFEGRHVPKLTSMPALEDVSFWDLPIHDKDLEPLKDCKWTKLGLGKTEVTDKATDVLVTMKHLENLNLAETSITDAAVGALINCESLEILSLEGTALSDAGLLDLAVLPGLQEIQVSKTSVTTGGITAFHDRRKSLKLEPCQVN